jgi:dolichol-phosphate mannosyltransferase
MNEAIRPGPESPPLTAGLPQLSVVVPTFNERENVTTLFRRLETTLAGVAWEVIFIDDNSPDGTWNVVRDLARQDPRVRCIRRIGRRGLSGACIEGILASSAPCAAVIDADLQHDETQLPKMLALLQSGSADLVVGSRYVEGGSADSFNKQRAGASALATEVAKRVLRVQIADPMSGFFMIRRDIVSRLAPGLSPDGFKILVDVILSDGGLKLVEVPYRFRKRLAGESKLTPLVGVDFLGLVAHHASGGLLPIRFVLFAIIGAIGLVVHIVTLSIFRSWFGTLDFNAGQLVATFVAMASNFLLNNESTYRTHRYRGFDKLRGFIAFALGCSVGALANIDIASWVYKSNRTWWLAGLAGAALSVVWNYAVSTNLIWRPSRRR